MSDKFKKFIEEYGHNKFCLVGGADDSVLLKMVESREDWLFITDTSPAFAHERLFLSTNISDNFDEICRYFEGEE